MSVFAFVLVTAFLSSGAGLTCPVPSDRVGVSFSLIPAVLGYSEVVDSNQTWRGNTVIGVSQDVLVANCTLTVAEGNVTVQGNLTFQNAWAVVETEGVQAFFFVVDYGNLTLMNTTMATTFRIVNTRNGTVEIADSAVGDLESQGDARTRVVGSSVNSTYAYDDAIQGFGLTWFAGRCVGWGTYWCPRICLYNCTVPVIEAANATLEIAHTVVETITSCSRVGLKFTNLTVTGNWTASGQLDWVISNGGRDIIIPDYRLDWGEDYASGTLDSNGANVIVEEMEVFSLPPAPIPANLLSTGTFVNMTLRGPKWAKKETMNRIRYTDEQVAGIELSTLKLYSYGPVEGWKADFEVTGINITERFVWGNITSEEEVFSLSFAAFGEPIHDIAVLDVKSSKTIVGQGYSVRINVTVANQGGATETFNLTVSVSPELLPVLLPIGTREVTLTNGIATTLTFTWDTTGWANGNYTVNCVPEVEDEVAVAFVDGWVVVTLPGDVDGDRDVDIFDIVRMAGVYGLEWLDPRYNPNCDIDGDSDIDIFDIVKATVNYGQSW